MITLFAIPKPFEGHIGIIQRNALASWARLHPRCDVILMGDDAGTAQAAMEFGFRHVPAVRRNEHGTPLLDDLFRQAEQLSHHEALAYVNADIILLQDFTPAVSRVARWRARFLMVGQRWDIDVSSPLDLSPGWENRLRLRLGAEGKLHPPTGIDYFAFSRGALGDIPPFAIGRTAWDNWLIYRARSRGVPVVDASAAVTAVHQNHDYSHHPQGAAGVWKGPEAIRNLELAGGRERLFLLGDANWRLTADGVRRHPLSRSRLNRGIMLLPVLRPALAPWMRFARRVKALAWRSA